MADDSQKKEDDIVSRETKATLKRTTVRLNELKVNSARFCHRPDDDLSEASLESLRESIVSENGIHVPVTYYVDGHGNKVLLRGHRRRRALLQLAERKEPGYTEDMEIPAEEVVGGSAQDHLVFSVFDNENRKPTDRISRIKTAKLLYDEGVPTPRAARAMHVNVKTYERDVLIAKYDWMFAYVIDGSISPTHALALLIAAEKEGRMAELKEDLDAWIADKKRAIAEKERLKKIQDGKELRPADKEVKRFMPNHLVTHWIDLIKAKRRFDDDAQWNYSAGIDKDAHQLRISSIVLDLNKASTDRMAKVGSKLSALTKQLGPYIQQRHAAESGEFAAKEGEAPYDLDYLRELGLTDVADGLEETIRTAMQPDGEEDPGHDQQPEREERDLTTDVELPPSGDTDNQQDDAKEQ